MALNPTSGRRCWMHCTPHTDMLEYANSIEWNRSYRSRTIRVLDLACWFHNGKAIVQKKTVISRTDVSLGVVIGQQSISGFAISRSRSLLY